MADNATAKLAAGSISIKRMQLISELSGQEMDLRTIIYEMSIYESLDKAFITADLLLGEAIALPSIMPIYGREIVEIEFKTPDPSIRLSVKLKLRVIRVQELQATNQRAAQYIIKLASEEYLTDLNTKISHSFVNMTIKDMVTSIGNDYLGIKQAKKTISTKETEGPRTFVIPNMSPTRAIKFLSKEARSGGYPASNFVFFENSDGYHFSTLDEIILAPYPSLRNPTRNTDPDNNPETGGGNGGQEVLIDYYYATEKDFKKSGADNGEWRGGLESDKPFELQKMNNFSFQSLFSNDRTLMSGGFENHYSYINPSFSLFEDRVYDYFKNYDDLEHTNGKATDNKLLTEENPVMSRSGDAYQIFSMTSKGESDPMITDQKPDFFHLRIGSMGLLEDIIVNIDVPGDSERRAGDIVRLQFPEYGATDDIRSKLNAFVSGDYLVIALRHIYNPETGYRCVMQCAKNCYEKDLNKMAKIRPTTSGLLPESTTPQNPGQHPSTPKPSSGRTIGPI